MKRGGLVFLLILTSACMNYARIDDVHLLKGYWQIEKVIFPDNSVKLYELGSTVDYLYLEDRKGFRKKVQPVLDGTFDTSDDAIPFEVQERHEDVYLVFSNGTDTWEELVLHLDSTTFAVRNAEGIIYEYTRYAPQNINDE